MSNYIHTDNNGVTVAGELAMVDGNMVFGHKYRLTGLIHRAPMELRFQCGAVPLNGANGWSSQALLSVLIDHTEQHDKHAPCVQNRLALQHLREALALLEARDQERRIDQPG